MDDLKNFPLRMDERHVTYMGDFWRFITIMEDNGLLERVIPLFSAAEYILTMADKFGPVRALLDPYTVEFLVLEPKKPLKKGAFRLDDLRGIDKIVVSTCILDGSIKFMCSSQLTVEFVAARELNGGLDCIDSALGFPLRTISHTRFMREDLVRVKIDGHVLTVPSPEAFMVGHMVTWDNYVYPETAPDPMISHWYRLDLKKMSDIIARLDEYEYKQVRHFLKGRGMNFKLPDWIPNI